MIDIHSHILPGMDDGAEDSYDALEMARMAVASGVTAMVATPHCNFPGVYDNYYDKDYIETFRRLERFLEDENIPLKIYTGMEVFVTPDVPELIEKGKLLTINGGRYMLVEFAFDEEPTYVQDMLQKIADMKLCPVIAHPERYEFLQDNPKLAYQWKEQGYLLQANKGSFVGRFGRRVRNMAYRLIDDNLLSVIASDCHSQYRRTPHMLDAYDELTKDYSYKRLKKLFEENPKRICQNMEMADEKEW